MWYDGEILFSTSFFLFSGNIIDTKLTHHKYEKANYKEMFNLENEESVNTYCVNTLKLKILRKFSGIDLVVYKKLTTK